MTVSTDRGVSEEGLAWHEAGHAVAVVKLGFTLCRVAITIDGEGHGPRRAGTFDGHVAGVVARRAALLEGGLVFLVHDDHAEVGDRREHRRARSDHDARLY